MLQLCATTLNVTWLASLKMNEMLIKEMLMAMGKIMTESFSLRYLTLLKGATEKNVRECNLVKNSIPSVLKLM
ncbi:hypothetical protein C3432_07535 [Citrobacter amalonaticus]|uniref:Uncharacterized protein n=1 Tax=Citrobacter amalonaticus TaxID=35703 RepID=A0A2S4RYB1_CITAM|nr:hypothetical protein C3432_07535 [Citrobacter amalonaticus]POT76688.1 hypothetical protein C3436_04290 [Citrobacter amalonaticus]POU65767.1 hypothetical protein C3430_10705 [Citrobacter amalonaticus]POV05924.1 hypothetical protein C3424_11590 [Citrobacter amalonaticus]